MEGRKWETAEDKWHMAAKVSVVYRHRTKKAPLGIFQLSSALSSWTAVLSQQSLTLSGKDCFLSTHWERVLPILMVKAYFRAMFYLLCPGPRKACLHMAGTDRGKNKINTPIVLPPMFSYFWHFLEFIAILFIKLQLRANLVLKRSLSFCSRKFTYFLFPHSSKMVHGT